VDLLCVLGEAAAQPRSNATAPSSAGVWKVGRARDDKREYGTSRSGVTLRGV